MSMRPLLVHRGTAVPFRRSSVDTDQIIPSRFLKRIARHGYEDALFADWREDPGFELNDPRLAGATILVAGADFGTGSSREAAVWALQDYGFAVVISPRFGDIFRSNAGKAGLLAVVLDVTEVERLWGLIDAQLDLELSVDVEDLTITAGTEEFRFELDADTRYRLLNGLDEIALTEQSLEAIAGFESRRAPWHPVAEAR